MEKELIDLLKVLAKNRTQFKMSIICDNKELFTKLGFEYINLFPKQTISLMGSGDDLYHKGKLQIELSSWGFKDIMDRS